MLSFGVGGLLLGVAFLGVACCLLFVVYCSMLFVGGFCLWLTIKSLLFVVCCCVLCVVRVVRNFVDCGC